MKYILFLFLLGGPGPHSEYQTFETLKACEDVRQGLSSRIVKFNEGTNLKEQVLLVSAVCAPIVKAPRGVET
jgi:hypothetical protein